MMTIAPMLPHSENTPAKGNSMNKLDNWVARRNIAKFRLQLSESKSDGEKATLRALLDDEQRKLSAPETKKS